MTTPIGEFVCPAAYSDRLDRALAAFVPGMSRTQARRLIDAGSVFIDGRRCRVAGRTVRGGERVRVALIDVNAIPTASADLIHVLFEDETIVAIDKPAGMPSAPTQQAATGTALDGLRQRLRASDPHANVHLVHRLDAATSGILVFAKDAPSAAALSTQFATSDVRKEYLAIVTGTPTAASGCIDVPLARRGGRALVCAPPGGRPSRTEWLVLTPMPQGTLLLVRPQSGRMHQIRVHLAHIGHPIVGDRIYGSSAGSSAAKRLMLHASRLEFAHPATGLRLMIRCAAPFAPELPST